MPPQNQPQKPAQPPVKPLESGPPTQSPVKPPNIPQAPWVAEEPATTAPQYRKFPDAGMITISDGAGLQFKFCWGTIGNKLALAHHLRDHFVVDAWGIFRAAKEFGFRDVLLLTRDSRISDQGDASEPPADKPDDVRKLFHDDKANPLGAYGKNVTHMSMKDEFETVARRKEAAGSTKGRPV